MAENNCLNCGATLEPQSKFCPSCGQSNKTSRISVKELFSEFLTDYFTFDSKLFRSIYPLLFKPGRLTSEYISGRRARYISPLRMYIFISIIYFFIISLRADEIISQPDVNPNEAGRAGSYITLGGERLFLTTIEDAYNTGNEVSLLDSLRLEKTAFNIFAVKTLAKQYLKYDKNPGGYAPQVLRTASIMMFLILPVFALLLKLFYIRHNYYYLDHLIFSFHFHSFIFLLLLILYFTIDAIPGIAITLSALLVLYYLYRSMRNVYRQKRRKTLLKMAGLLSAGFVILLFSFLSTMLISFVLF